MRALAADNSKAGLVGQLEEVWDSLAVLGAGLDDAGWATDTPCPGWPVSAQYAHIIGTESMILGRPNPDVKAPAGTAHVRNDIGGFNEVWVTALAGQPREDVLEAFAEVVSARREVLAGMTDDDFSAPSWTPVGQADYRRFMQIRVFDCWVHEQDVRDAVGRSGHESGPVAEQAIDEIARAAGFIVGKKAGAPQGSGVRIDLTGPVTRRIDVDVAERARVVDELAGEPTAALELSSTAFARLACGRVAPSEVKAGAFGGANLLGDEGLAGRLLENLAFTI